MGLQRFMCLLLFLGREECRLSRLCLSSFPIFWNRVESGLLVNQNLSITTPLSFLNWAHQKSKLELELVSKMI